MGFTSVSRCCFNEKMRQTPHTVSMVLDFAGWNANEAATASGVDALNIHLAATGQAAMIQDEWKKLLDVAGRRAFDEGCDE